MRFHPNQAGYIGPNLYLWIFTENIVTWRLKLTYDVSLLVLLSTYSFTYKYYESMSWLIRLVCDSTVKIYQLKLKRASLVFIHSVGLFFLSTVTQANRLHFAGISWEQI